MKVYEYSIVSFEDTAELTAREDKEFMSKRVDLV